MGKTPERRVFASAPLRYRRKVPVPEDNQQPDPADVKQAEEKEPKQQQQQRKQHQFHGRDRISRSPPARRFRPKGGRQPKHHAQQQLPLLKQLLWKAKAVQPTPESLGIRPLPTEPQQKQEQQNDDQEENDEEAAFAQQQRQARKLLASEAVGAFVAESSSQETQSGSEDEAVFLPYNALPTTQWALYAKEQQQREEEESAGSAEETDGEEAASPVMPSETADDEESLQKKEQGQDELEKATATRRKSRQKYKLRQKQKRAAAKEQKHLQHQQRQQQEEEHERPRSTDGDSTLEDESTAVDIFHPPTNLARDMDAGLCRAVLSQLQDVVPFIVVGDVACPVVVDSDEQSAVSAKGGANAADSDAAVVDFREHVIAMLDRSQQTQMQHRDSFVVESSGFDAASSYDFFKRRFCEVQRSAGIVYY